MQDKHDDFDAKQKLWEVAQRFISEGAKCLTCGRPADGVGTFVPNDPQLFGAPENKHRVIFYPMCRQCAAHLESVAEIAEACMEKELSGVSEH